MSTLSRTIGIRARVDDVFEFVTDPKNWKSFVSGLLDVREISPGGLQKGSVFVWEYSMMGMRLSGRGEVTGFEKNRKFGLSLAGKFPITERYEFIERPEGTELAVEIDYEMPEDILGKTAGRNLVEQYNEIEATCSLDKLKLLCEALVMRK
ncbi:MAG: SRPBCC family protein [Nitrospiraceae bacterium]|nr:SRPBCC family protein [Nitrospiraceae bacterium]